MVGNPKQCVPLLASPGREVDDVCFGLCVPEGTVSYIQMYTRRTALFMRACIYGGKHYAGLDIVLMLVVGFLVG